MKTSLFIKYLFDKVAALLGIIILSPIILIIFIIHKIVMPDGGFIFLQERIGQYGKKFYIYKIRTMKAGSDNKNMFVTTATDDRILPFGKWLRKTKLDEIVELVNVLKGEMSFVGPRPDVEGYADKLEGEDRKVLELRPGITGPASLKYINEEEILAKVDNPQQYNDEVIFPDKVKINLDYYHNRTFWGDIRIILKTVFYNHS
ncbi:MAG: sugar transferase [Bacteroidales bacterium]|nr:sugar transferase [Bacteroidales bacterium]